MHKEEMSAKFTDGSTLLIGLLVATIDQLSGSLRNELLEQKSIQRHWLSKWLWRVYSQSKGDASLQSMAARAFLDLWAWGEASPPTENEMEEALVRLETFAREVSDPVFQETLKTSCLDEQRDGIASWKLALVNSFADRLMNVDSEAPNAAYCHDLGYQIRRPALNGAALLSPVTYQETISPLPSIQFWKPTVGTRQNQRRETPCDIENTSPTSPCSSLQPESKKACR